MAGSKTRITPGYPQIWDFSPRTFGGRAVGIVGKISDVDGSWTFGTPVTFSAGANKAGATILAGNPFLVAQVTGHNGAGAVTVAGAVVGDKVLSVVDMTAAPAANVSADFESTISVAGQIQQTSTDLHLSTALIVTVIHQS